MPPRIDFARHRLFVEAPLAAGVPVGLAEPAARYLGQVLRLGVDDRFLAFNGRDGEWRLRIDGIAKRALTAVPEARLRAQTPPSRLCCAFAPLKMARLDYLVQKLVEMGAGTIVPVITARTQVSRVNAERLRANIIEAAEQCGILSVPALADEVRLGRWLDAVPADRTLVFCDEFAELTDPIAALAGVPRGRPISVLIGPEGGFDDAERQRLCTMPNVIRLALGPRIMRADTAAVAALALVQAVCGDWDRPEAGQVDS
jgi:16S rRNA (uracil1498-N3)-methyltransferase